MGQIPRRANIINVTNSLPCEVETEEPHAFLSDEFIRITDLNGGIKPPHGPRGLDAINNYRFKIKVTGENTFDLYHPVTNLPVDSTAYTPYLEGGYATIIEQVFFYHNDDEEEE